MTYVQVQASRDQEAGYSDRFWQSADGLRLHYRDYPGSSERPPILCLHGLTRNARDFENLAARLCGVWRVVCPDLRGRGDSGYARDAASYNPQQYVEDLERLLAEAGIKRFVAIGTSLGGILTMLLAQRMPGAIAGAVINDIGPEVMPSGIARILSYVGQGRSFPTWMHAARAMEEQHLAAFPDFRIADWLAAVKRMMVIGGNGRIVFDYDMKIAEPLLAGTAAPPVDLWSALDALKGKPTALIRGELSDILGKDIHRKMAKALTGSLAVTIKRVGHAPTLDEDAAVAAIAQVLAQVE